MKLLSRLLLMLLLLPAIAWGREVPIEDFFKDAEFSSVRLSPDGQHLAVIVPQSDRTVLAVLRVSDRKVVGKWDYGENRHFQNVEWANNKRLLFWVGFKLGRFDFKVAKGDLYASNIDGTGRLDIPNGAYYSVVDLTPDDPDTILVSRSVENAFLFKLNVNNGKVSTVASAPIDGGTFLVDHQQKARFAFGEMKDGRSVTYRLDTEGKWQILHESARAGSVFQPVMFDADDEHVFVLKSDAGEPESLVRMKADGTEQQTVSDNGKVDAFDFLTSSDDKNLLAVGYEDGKPEWDFIAPENSEAKVYAGLLKAFPGKALDFSGTSEDGRYFLFRTYADRAPSEVFLYDVKEGKAKYLLSSREWIKPEEMSEMRPISFKARDGMELYGYITIPNGSDGKNLPLIINPHGGPHGVRDEWGFNPEVQLFANRGYAVLQLNYRGSGGYGESYERAGYRKWGTTMQDDLTDAVRWAVSQGMADGARVCIYGASYGGYAALMSPVHEPDLYKCTVGYAGVYDLDIQRTKSDTSESEFGRSYLNDVLPATSAERKAQSPLYGIERLKAPLMLVHGRKDVRVPIKNMDDLIVAMKKVGKAPEEVVVEDKEAHGFRDVKNNVRLYTKMLAFFDKHIGARSTQSPP